MTATRLIAAFVLAVATTTAAATHVGTHVVEHNACSFCGRFSFENGTVSSKTLAEGWGGPSPAEEYAVELAMSACELANSLACHRGQGVNGCWSTAILGGLMNSAGGSGSVLEGIVDKTASLIGCGSANCTRSTGQLASGPILTPLLAIFALVLLIMAGRALIDREKLGKIPIFLGTVTLAIIANSFIVYEGRNQLWEFTGHVANLGGVVGLAFSEATADAGTSTTRARITVASQCVETPPDAAFDTPGIIATGGLASASSWSDAHKAIDALTRQATEITATYVGVGRLLLGGWRELMSTTTAPLGAVKGILSGQYSDITELAQVTRYMFAMILIMGGLTIIVNVAVLTIEAVLSTTIYVALLPLSVYLGVFRAARSPLRSTAMAVINLAMTLAILGITVAMGGAILGLSLEMFASMLQPKPQDVEPLQIHLCGADAAIGALREAFTNLIHRVGCLSKGRYTATVLHEKAGLWLLPTIMFCAAAMTTGAIIKFTASLAAELSSFQGAGQISQEVAQRTESAGQSLGQKGGHMLAKMKM